LGGHFASGWIEDIACSASTVNVLAANRSARCERVGARRRSFFASKVFVDMGIFDQGFKGSGGAENPFVRWIIVEVPTRFRPP
jgi:hypothetical protein